MASRLIVIAAAVLLAQIWCCQACLEEERLGLMQLHTSFNISDENLSFFYAGIEGVPWGKSANCCDWIKVTCDHHTRRVTELLLSSTRDWGSRDSYLNASLFLPFKQLTTLDLSSNGIVNCLENEGFERLKSLETLENLYLNDNRFSNDILSSLSSLSSLKLLNLGYNRLKGKLYCEELNNLKNVGYLYMDGNEIEELICFKGGKLRLSNLNILDLGYNLFNNNVLSSLEGLSNLEYLNLEYNQLGESFNITKLATLENLEELSLSGNKNIQRFVASKDVKSPKHLTTLSLSNMSETSLFLSSLGAFPYIQDLELQFNNLTETLLNHSICNLKHLQSLDLSYNNLVRLPRCFTNLTSFGRLDLSYNFLVGNVSSILIPFMSSIQILSLAGNYFQIPTSFVPFYNCSELWSLDVRGNEFFAEKEPHDLTPNFQLQKLIMDGGGYEGFFPRFLYYQYNLQSVYVKNNQVKGEFPYWLLENNTGLQALTLSNISMHGSIKLQNHSHRSLSWLDLSSNYLNNQIPKDLGSCFPSLFNLNMSYNDLNGSIPSSLGNIRSLVYLYLSNNQFSGTIPIFSGSSLLRVVDLSQNRLHGSLTNSFSNSSHLTSLDLRHNFLTGNIPKWIGNLPVLLLLLLGHNHFEGGIPTEICRLDILRLLDLSNNNLSGEIPSCLKCSSIDGSFYSVFLYGIEFTTKSITYSFYGYGITFRFFSGVDLSRNQLTGHIPPELGNLSRIQDLNLSHNCFRGPIPSTFSNLQEIESLDLSHNNLEGKIPPELTQLNSISFFTVAYNNLSGKTPDMVKQFATFENISYEGNPFLCGKPLSKSCEAEVSPSPLPKPSGKNNGDVGFMDMEAFYVSFAGSYVVVLLGIAAVLGINPYWRRAWFLSVEMMMIDFYCFIVCNFKRLFRFRT